VNLTTAKDNAIDRLILKLLQQDCRIPLDVLAKKIGVPKSTLHYRIKRLEKEGVIGGYYAKVDPLKLGYDYVAVVLVKARYGPNYHEKLGKKIAKISGVWGVYYVLGEYDFIVLIRAKDREDYMNKLELMSSMPDIERTNTQVAAKVLVEDPRVSV